MDKEFLAAIRQISDEKGLTEDMVVSTIEAAMAAAYRKDYGAPNQKIEAKFDKETGKTILYRLFEVVENIEDEESQVLLKDAKKSRRPKVSRQKKSGPKASGKKIKIGDFIKEKLDTPDDYGRIAAQTAKQVIIQKIRELERDVLFDEFKEKEGSLLTGVVQQIDGQNIIINLGKANGIIFPQEQMQTEKYYLGQRLKVYLVSVEKTSKGPLISVSRAHPELIRKLFELEVPEINSNAIEIKAITREAGKRTKMAVIANQDGVDPIGSCVGQRGTRVQSVLAEIGEEKIDIVLWDKNIKKFIENSLSPAKIKKVTADKKNKKAKVIVAEDQLSLAIGKEGQNVRLASKLTGYEIDVVKIAKKGAKKDDEKKKDKKDKISEKDETKSEKTAGIKSEVKKPRDQKIGKPDSTNQKTEDIEPKRVKKSDKNQTTAITEKK